MRDWIIALIWYKDFYFSLKKGIVWLFHKLFIFWIIFFTYKKHDDAKCWWNIKVSLLWMRSRVDYINFDLNTSLKHFKQFKMLFITQILLTVFSAIHHPCNTNWLLHSRCFSVRHQIIFESSWILKHISFNHYQI